MLQRTILHALLWCRTHNVHGCLQDRRKRDIHLRCTQDTFSDVIRDLRHWHGPDLLPYANKLRQRDGLIDDRLHNALLDHFEDLSNLLQEGRQPHEQRRGRQRRRGTSSRGTSTALPVLIVPKPTTFAIVVRTRKSSPTPSHVSWATHVASNQTHNR